MLFRRELLGKAAVGAPAAVTLSVARPRGGAAHAGAAGPDAPTGPQAGREPEPPPGGDTLAGVEASAVPPPWELVSPLTAGAVVAAGWRLVDLGPVRDGSCVMTLGNERGRSHRIHLCRNDVRPQGLVHTDRFDLLVMNGGQGDLPTEEGSRRRWPRWRTCCRPTRTVVVPRSSPASEIAKSAVAGAAAEKGFDLNAIPPI